MSMHTYHPDSHEHGLADDCPRCDEHAEHPFESLDTENLRNLIVRVRDDLEPRSDNEARAMRHVHRAMLAAATIRAIEEDL